MLADRLWVTPAQVLSLEIDQIQQRDGRWVIPHLVGKGRPVADSVPVPAAVKVRDSAIGRDLLKNTSHLCPATLPLTVAVIEIVRHAGTASNCASCHLSEQNKEGY